MTALSLTKEAVNDPEKAAHGADHRGHDLVSPLDLLITLQAHLSQAQQFTGVRHLYSQDGGAALRGTEEGRGGGGGWISGLHH